MLKVNGLRKEYAGFTLDIPELEVHRGEVIGLLGHNGAGKSTLLKALAGAIPIQKTTTITIDSSVVPTTHLSRYVALITENHPLYGWMKVNEFLHFTSHFYDSWSKNQCNALMESFKVPGGKKINELSKGNQLKVALISALSHQPKILLLDEPTAGLDVASRSELLEYLDDLRSKDTLLIFSSHLVDDLQSLATSIAILSRGSLRMLGSKETLCNDWVAYVLYAGVDIRSISSVRADDGSRIVVLPRGKNLPDELLNENTVSGRRKPSLKELFLAEGGL